MTEDDVGQWVSQLIAADNLHEFYTSPEWEYLRQEVLSAAKDECQWCKKRGFYSPANTVHHVQFVRKHPRLALSMTYTYGGVSYVNLVALCRSCHETAHPRCKPRKPPLTEERW